MKRAFEFILAVLMLVALCACGKGENPTDNTRSENNIQSHWKRECFVDEFGDKTDDEFIIGTFNGTFSNSVTQASNLTVCVYFDTEYSGMTSIRLLEYGNNIANFDRCDSIELKAKDSSGAIYNFEMKPVNGDLCSDSLSLLYLLQRNENLSIVITATSKNSKSSNTYHFKVDNVGLYDLLLEEDEVFDENIAVEEELDIIREASVGSVVPFGSYDHRLAWIVLEKDNGKALLVSKRVLDRKPYADNPQKATWEACSLREWLNDSFYNEAFSKKEQQCIVLSTLESQSDGQEGVTQDKVFILNMLEHQKYYDQIPNYGKVFATQYAAKFYSPDLIEWFWIRSSISDSYEDGNAKAMNANSNERLCTITQANLEYGGVRPVICVDLK